MQSIKSLLPWRLGCELQESFCVFPQGEADCCILHLSTCQLNVTSSQPMPQTSDKYSSSYTELACRSVLLLCPQFLACISRVLASVVETKQEPVGNKAVWLIQNESAKECFFRFERSWLGRHNQGKSSCTPVTSDLSKTFHQICLWLHQLVKNQNRVQKTV